MKFSIENTLCLVTDWTRAELQILKQVPAKSLVAGKRFKFDRTVASVEYVRNEFPDAEYSKTFPQPKSMTSTRKGFEMWTTPYEHQQRLLDETWDKEYYAFFWEMGLGKSKIAIDTVAKLYHEGIISSMLVLTLNGVHLNWTTEELPKHLSPNCDVKAVAWDSNRFTAGTKYYMEQLDTIMMHDGLTVLSVNLEALGRKKSKAIDFMVTMLKKRDTLVCIDESHTASEMTAQRTKNILKRIRPHAKYRRIMTGTPSKGGPLELYAQTEFLKPGLLGHDSFWSYRSHYSVMEILYGKDGKPKLDRRGKAIEIVKEYRNISELNERLKPFSSRLTKDECLDLPPKIYSKRPFMLTEEQRRIYKDLCDETAADFSGGRVSATMAITRMIRLQQIVCGFAVTDDEAGRPDEILGVPICEGVHPRLQTLIDVCEGVQGKGIIWATFRYSLREIFIALTERYGKGSVVGYHGGTSREDRLKAVDRFQNDPTCQWFLGQPRAGGTGITLTAANDVIYYSNDFSLTIRLQSEDRPHRIGQNNSVNYIDILGANTLDYGVIEALSNKMDISTQITGDVLLDWIT